MTRRNPAAKKSKPKTLPLSVMIGRALVSKTSGRGLSRTMQLANDLVDALSRDSRVKDPVRTAHKLLNREDRRALGERAYKYGHGAFAPSIRGRRR